MNAPSQMRLTHNIMRFFLMTFCFALILGLCFIFVHEAAQACTPPKFPYPEVISTLEIAAGTGSLSNEEKDFLSDYKEDRSRYFTLFERLYPCPPYEQAAETMREKDKGHTEDTGPNRRQDSERDEEQLRAEMRALERKWTADDIRPDASRPQDGTVIYNPVKSEGGYTIPAEQKLLHFE